MVGIIATVANGAVRLSIGPRLVGLIYTCIWRRRCKQTP